MPPAQASTCGPGRSERSQSRGGRGGALSYAGAGCAGREGKGLRGPTGGAAAGALCVAAGAARGRGWRRDAQRLRTYGHSFPVGLQRGPNLGDLVLEGLHPVLDQAQAHEQVFGVHVYLRRLNRMGSAYRNRAMAECIASLLCLSSPIASDILAR
jgi:hypothetical protein